MVHCPACGIVPVPEDQLPVVLPAGIEITGQHGSPLDHVAEFVEVACPECGGAARRDTDTMDTFVDSSWYFFRYCDPNNATAPFDSSVVNYWFPIDQYIGGREHTNMHLIYCRFWTKFMRDLGLVKVDEPALRLLNQGMVCMFAEKTGRIEKMSKSVGNVVEPDEMCARFGADATRLYILFASPPEKDVIWEVKRGDSGDVEYPGIEGAFRYLARVWRLAARWLPAITDLPHEAADLDDQQRALRRKTHQTIKRCTDAFEERMRLNTAIAGLMELTNAMYEFAERAGEPSAASDGSKAVMREAFDALVRLLTPFAPHLASELWETLGNQQPLAKTPWPEYKAELAREDRIEIPVQVNGKLRARLEVAPDVDEQSLRDAALADDRIATLIAGKELAKVVVVPGRLINLVLR
jgi:leucyl-tRNA synthetase